MKKSLDTFCQKFIAVDVCAKNLEIVEATSLGDMLILESVDFENSASPIWLLFFLIESFGCR